MIQSLLFVLVVVLFLGGGVCWILSAYYLMVLREKQPAATFLELLFFPATFRPPLMAMRNRWLAAFGSGTACLVVASIIIKLGSWLK